MLTHVVLLRLKQGTSRESVDLLYREISGLQDKIEGVISITGGTNNSPEKKDGGYTEGFIVEFRDAQARDRYLDHPEHKSVAERYIEPIVEDFIVFDYERAP